MSKKNRNPVRYKISTHMDTGQTVIRNGRDQIVANMEVDNDGSLNPEEIRLNAILFSKSGHLLSLINKLRLVLSGYMSDTPDAPPSDYRLLDKVDALVKEITYSGK